MPGVIHHHRFCEYWLECEGEDTADVKGQCGVCSGNCQPCDEAGENCGDWQDCTCAGDCGDGHYCKEYVDLRIELDSFVIQYETYCHCGPAVVTGCDITNPHEIGNETSGVKSEVTIPATVHNIRMVRSACGCHWGGFWNSSCDCNTCCCTTNNAYSACPEAEVITCQTIANCYDPSGASCAACDPDRFPCYTPEDGYASSMDDWGVGTNVEKGQSDNNAICVMMDTAVAGCGNYATPDDDCGDDHEWLQTCDNCAGCYPDSWYQTNPAGNTSNPPGGNSYACTDGGKFTPFHMEASLHYNSPASGCAGSWELKIHGMTDMIRNQSGAGSHGCNCPNLVQYALFDASWTSIAGPPNCGAAVAGLGANGCTCPPELDFESTVNCNNLEQLHPNFIYDDGCSSLTKSGCRAPDAFCGGTLPPNAGVYNGAVYNKMIAFCQKCVPGNLPVGEYSWLHQLSPDSPNCVDVAIAMTPNNNPVPSFNNT